jgi:hypothetical protein
MSMLEQCVALGRAAVRSQGWNAELAAGRALPEPEALALLRSLGTHDCLGTHASFRTHDSLARSIPLACTMRNSLRDCRLDPRRGSIAIGGTEAS